MRLRTKCVLVRKIFCIPRALAIQQRRHRARVIGDEPSAHWAAGHFVFTSTYVGRERRVSRVHSRRVQPPTLEHKATRSGTVRPSAPVPSPFPQGTALTVRLSCQKACASIQADGSAEVDTGAAVRCRPTTSAMRVSSIWGKRRRRSEASKVISTVSKAIPP